MMSQCGDWGWKNRKASFLSLSSTSSLSSMKAIPSAISRVTRSGSMKGFGVIAGEDKFGGCSFIHLTDDIKGLLPTKYSAFGGE